MTICDLQRGDRAVILKVDLPAGVRDRLFGLDLHTGARIFVLKVSLRKRMFLVQSGGSRVAIRREAAQGIRVWRI